MIFETAILIGQTILLFASTIAVFILCVLLCLVIEKLIKQHKKKKRARARRQKARKEQLKRHETEFQAQLFRKIYKVECENIELGERKIYRQTIYINGKLATPLERAAFMEGAFRNVREENKKI